MLPATLNEAQPKSRAEFSDAHLTKFVALDFVRRCNLQRIRGYRDKGSLFRCRKQHQFVATELQVIWRTLCWFVSMPQAASVRCNFLRTGWPNERKLFRCRKQHQFVATTRKDALRNCSKTFRCRKQHQFVATCPCWKTRLARGRFRCRKQHQFVATIFMTNIEKWFTAVSMPQAASVRCN